MASGIGTFILDFGSGLGSNEANVTVSGQTGISADTPVEAFMMAEESVDHTVQDATYAALFIALTCAAPAGDSFTVYARSEHKLTGHFVGRYVWAD